MFYGFHYNFASILTYSNHFNQQKFIFLKKNLLVNIFQIKLNFLILVFFNFFNHNFYLSKNVLF